MTLRVADLLRDQALLPAVRRLADEILRRDEGAATALIDRWIGAARRYGQV
jgi:ATP-dependent DNA helicase RecG